jgi:NAD-dependent deacetylase
MTADERRPSVIPEALVDALRKARAVVALTGAGVSAESGIPTFRDAMEGLWSKFDPHELATPEGFARDPETVTRWYDWRREKCAAAKPNAAHLALARLENHLAAQKRAFMLLTQNVDRLHQAAGSGNVVELHGTLWLWRCIRCGVEREERNVPFREYPPRCACGGTRRPAVVWFGEMLPEDAMQKAHDALGTCDLFFSIGTSAVVEPAASFIHSARRRGARTVEINRDPTPISSVVDWSLLGRAGEILPEVVKITFGI